jgi:lipid-A-disaccharide synthase
MARTTSDLAALRYTAARPGATSRAAEAILARLRGPAPDDAAYRGPHARAVNLESIEENGAA